MDDEYVLIEWKNIFRFLPTNNFWTMLLIGKKKISR